GHGEALDALAVAEARGLLVADGADHIRFEDPLVRDVVHASTPADVRRALHGDAAAAIGDDGDRVVLGHHRLAAGEREAAVELLSRAGEAALRDDDHAAARRNYTAALGAAREAMLQSDDLGAKRGFVTVSVGLARALAAEGAVGVARGVLAEARDHAGEDARTAGSLARAGAWVCEAEGAFDRAMAAIRDAIGHAIVAGQRGFLCDLYLDLAT